MNCEQSVSLAGLTEPLWGAYRSTIDKSLDLLILSGPCHDNRHHPRPTPAEQAAMAIRRQEDEPRQEGAAKEGGAHSIKIEGGKEIADSITKIVNAGIPVMGHLGLTPQSIYQFGTYKVRAKEDAEAEKLIEDAQLLESLGCFALVLEKIPAALAKKVTESISIPTIGIGAGADCDGQVLVFHDMVGMNKGFSPKFLRRYLDLYTEITGAVASYVKDVKTADFPNENEHY